jgi:hypothetical protein
MSAPVLKDGADRQWLVGQGKSTERQEGSDMGWFSGGGGQDAEQERDEADRQKAAKAEMAARPYSQPQAKAADRDGGTISDEMRANAQAHAEGRMTAEEYLAASMAHHAELDALFAAFTATQPPEQQEKRAAFVREGQAIREAELDLEAGA